MSSVYEDARLALESARASLDQVRAIAEQMPSGECVREAVDRVSFSEVGFAIFILEANRIVDGAG